MPDVKQVLAENSRLQTEAEQRAAELAIVNSIQQGTSAGMDFQTIVDLVGDQLRRIFDGADMAIQWYDDGANLLHAVRVFAVDG